MIIYSTIIIKDCLLIKMKNKQWQYNMENLVTVAM